jgi:hypothetical protein
MITAKILGYYWIDGKLNQADIVSKNWSYPQIWHLLKPLLFDSGDPRDLIEPVEESNGKAKLIVQCKNWNNSETTTMCHPIRSELERSTPVDEIRVLDHQNPADIDEDTIILVIIIQTQFHHTGPFVVTNVIT